MKHSYSRRELYALGEPLGDSVTRIKAGGGLILGGGGGGSRAPSTQTSITDLPDWAKPYAQETLAQAKAVTESPYQRYDEPRIAGFSPLQEQAMQTTGGMQPSQLGVLGGQLAGAATMGALGTGYNPYQAQNQYTDVGQYNPFQFQNQFQDPGMYQPGQFAAERIGGPQLSQYQMGPAERVRADRFGGQQAEQYMSPFIEQALQPQLRELGRQSEMLRNQQQAQAVGQGAFGGSRQAIVEAERQRNLGQQQSDVLSRGYQTAFEQAQQQFNQDAARRLQAQQLNQQAGLTVGGQNLGALLSTQQLGAQTGLQAALANQQQAMQAQQLAEQSRQFGAGQGMTAAQLQAQYGLSADQAAEASRQYASNFAAQQAAQRAQYGQAAQQLAEQSRQYGAGLGMQGFQTALQGAGQLGALGGQEFGQQKDIVGMQSQLGAQQQALRQQGLTQAYQDFLNEQNYPYKQLGFMSDMIRGLPLGQQSTKQVYEAPGSITGQLGGIGMGLYGLSRAGVFGAAGGEVKEYAEGGEVTSQYNVDDIISKLSDVQLQQARMAALNSGDQQRLEMIDSELAQRVSMRAGLGGAFNSLPEDTQENIISAASGGIVALANGGDLGIGPEFGGSQVEGPSINPLDIGRRLRGGKSIEEYYGEPAFRSSAPAALAATADGSYEKAESKRLTQARSQPRKESKPIVKSEAVAQGISQIAAQAGVPREAIEDRYARLLKEIESKDAEDIKAIRDMVEKSTGGSKEIKERALGEALANFGFQMAAAASKPGATFFGSAATASPTLASSMAESAKLAREMDRNDVKLQTAQKQFELARRADNRKEATVFASQIEQLERQQEMLNLKRQELAQTGAYQQGSLANQRAGLAQKAESDKLRGLSAAANLQRAQASVLEVGRKAGLDFDNNRQNAQMLTKLTEQYGADKARYLYNQQRRAYISEATQGARAQAESDVQARSVFDLLGQE